MEYGFSAKQIEEFFDEWYKEADKKGIWPINKPKQLTTKERKAQPWRVHGESEEKRSYDEDGYAEIHAYLNEKEEKNEVAAFIRSTFLFDGERKTPIVVNGRPGKVG